MIKHKKARRLLVFLLTFSIIVSPFQGLAPQVVEAATDDISVQVGRAVIRNASNIHSQNLDDNMFANFDPNVSEAGFSANVSDGGDAYKIVYAEGNINHHDEKSDKTRTSTFKIDISQNAKLKELARSHDAELNFGWDYLAFEDGGVYPWEWSSETEMEVKINGSRVHYEKAIGTDKEIDGTERTDPRNITKKLNGINTIEFVITTEDGDSGGTGVRGLFIKFQDTNRPTLNGYTFTGNGSERLNSTLNQPELFVKQGENISLSYNFSEPVKPSSVVSSFSEFFLKHPLFVNEPGTGLPAAGQQQYLENLTYTSNNLGTYHNKIMYQYVGSKYHSSANNPLTPKITGSSGGASPIDQTLEEKFKSATFIDAAGNVATINFPNKADQSSNGYIRGKAINPFDFNNGGYRVIVDAVAPKYTKSGNGIQPEILTGVVLNENDTIDFTVQLTEASIVKEGWNASNLFLHFNNGMKARYVSGAGTDKWLFRADISNAEQLETPLLKVIALTHESKPGITDTNVLQDYAGNLLIQPANLNGTHTEPGVCTNTVQGKVVEVACESLVNSKIDWANLSIDNTVPIIDFRYEVDGASDTIYQKNGRVTIDANDPQLKVPALDPENPNTFRPSKGIFRPSNMTGTQAPAVGLVYYVWSQDPDDPFIDYSEDNFAALKRYSLSAIQPGVELYPGNETELRVVNNKTNMISPPAEALTSEKSGEWYLHTWTSDMTWDSARELMQYEKMKTFVANNRDKYAEWKAEKISIDPNASDADQVFYANNKAIEAVGDYANTSIWQLSDFKQKDSNWIYKRATLKLDNTGPAIMFAEPAADNTADVKVSVNVSDPYSGVKQILYQWVKVGNSPLALNWEEVGNIGNEGVASKDIEVSTLNNEMIFGDGQYELHIETVDAAGNKTMMKMENTVTVNSIVNMEINYSPEPNPNFVQSHDVVFEVIKGIDSQEVMYAFSTSLMRPSVEEFQKAEEINHGVPRYLIPKEEIKNGRLYLHTRVQDADGKYYYFNRLYYFNNQGPTVFFSSNGVSFPKESHEVGITISSPITKDNDSEIARTEKYQWKKLNEEINTPNENGWVDLTEDGIVRIDHTSLAQDEDYAEYKLFVWVVDEIGNETIASTTGTFKVFKSLEDDNSPPAESEFDLLYILGDEEDGYTAIVKLNLKTEDKRGYNYSLSPDNGESWTKWRPYTNFAGINVPTNNIEDLKVQVKYRTGAGVISPAGKEVSLNTSTISRTKPIYALASLSTTKPVNGGIGVDINIAPPLGVRVIPSEANPSEPVRTNGNTFNVKENGYYSFELTDLADPTLKETLYIVVDNVDSKAPIGNIDYLITSPTNSNVTVKLVTDEPVRITNNNGRSTYTFKENGSFTFEFQDQAGNIATAIAEVTYIYKEAPKVKIAKIYDDHKTIVDVQGNVLLSSGVTLEVQKMDESSRDFFVNGGVSTQTLVENNFASFVVYDEYGNTTIVKEKIDTIISAGPAVNEMTYTFVDEFGIPLNNDQVIEINGQLYAKGRVKVAIKGQTLLPNKVFSGVTPITDVNGDYTNLISDVDGAFTYSKTYSTNGTTLIRISDLLGNIQNVPVKVLGLDNTNPEITLNMDTVGIIENKADFDFRVDLGGFTTSDNVSSSENIDVQISGLDLTKKGYQKVTYTVTDQVGNMVTAYQDVYVVSSTGMLIFADNVLISGDSGLSALFDHNTLTFTISRFNIMKNNGIDLVNEWGTFDLLYKSGLYREGQMKYVAEKITYEELVKGTYTVTFPKTGWYTLIVRNQEREREYASFFIGKVN